MPEPRTVPFPDPAPDTPTGGPPSGATTTPAPNNRPTTGAPDPLQARSDFIDKQAREAPAPAPTIGSAIQGAMGYLTGNNDAGNPAATAGMASNPGAGGAGWDAARIIGAMGAESIATQRAIAVMTGLQATGVPMTPWQKALVGIGVGATAATLGELPGILGQLWHNDELDLTSPEGWEKLKTEAQGAAKWNYGGGAVFGTVGLGGKVLRDAWHKLAYGETRREAIARAKSFSRGFEWQASDQSMQDRTGVKYTGEDAELRTRASKMASDTPLPQSAYFTRPWFSATMENLFGGAITGWQFREKEAARAIANTDFLGNFFRRVGAITHPDQFRSIIGTFLEGGYEVVDDAIDGLAKATVRQAKINGNEIVDLHGASSEARKRLKKLKGERGDTKGAPPMEGSLAEGQLGGGADNPAIVQHVEQHVMPGIRQKLLAKHNLTEEQVAEVLASPKAVKEAERTAASNLLFDSMGQPIGTSAISKSTAETKLARAVTAFNDEYKHIYERELGSFSTVEMMLGSIKAANADAAGAYKASLTAEGAGVSGHQYKSAAQNLTDIMEEHFKRNPGNKNAAAQQAWYAYRDLTRGAKVAYVEKNKIARLLLDEISKGEGVNSKAADALYSAEPDVKAAFMHALDNSPIDHIVKFASSDLTVKEAQNLQKALDKLHGGTRKRLGTATGLETGPRKILRQQAAANARQAYLDSIAERAIKPRNGVNELSIDGFLSALNSQGERGLRAVLTKDHADTALSFMQFVRDVNANPVGQKFGEVLSFRMAGKAEDVIRQGAKVAGKTIASGAALGGGAASLTGSTDPVSGAMIGAGMAVGVAGAYFYLPYKMGKLMTSKARIDKLMQIVDAVNNPTRDLYSGLSRNMALATGPLFHNVKHMIEELRTMDDEGNVPTEVKRSKWKLPSAAASPAHGKIPMGVK